MYLENKVFRVSYDSFNSENFGIKMGNVYLVDNSAELCPKDYSDSFSSIIDISKEAGFKHITFKIDTSKKEVIKGVHSHSMELADTLVRYLFDFSRSDLPTVNHKCSLGDCSLKDLQQLKDIARNSFKIDRFHSDDNLPNHLCDLYYDKWIENSYNGLVDKVIVAYYNGEAVGFTTGKLKMSEEYSQLVLSAVSDKYRGIGVYTSMIHEGTKWLLNEMGSITKGVIVGTQIDNIAVQKAWIKLGYTLFDSQYVFQKYLD